MKTNVGALEEKLPLSCFRSSEIAVASPAVTDDCLELSPLQKRREAIPRDTIDVLATVKECRRLTGLSDREILLGVAPSPRHRATLRGYLRMCHGNAREIREVLIHDLRSYLEIGARCFAADQLIVLRLFLADQLRDVAMTPATLPQAWMIDREKFCNRRH
jgi:hypothetical protein